MATAKKYTQRFKNMLVTLYHDGASKASIAEEYHVTQQTLSKWIKDYDTAHAARDEADRLTAEQREDALWVASKLSMNLLQEELKSKDIRIKDLEAQLKEQTRLNQSYECRLSRTNQNFEKRLTTLEEANVSYQREISLLNKRCNAISQDVISEDAFNLINEVNRKVEVCERDIFNLKYPKRIPSPTVDYTSRPTVESVVEESLDYLYGDDDDDSDDVNAVAVEKSSFWKRVFHRHKKSDGWDEDIFDEEFDDSVETMEHLHNEDGEV